MSNGPFLVETYFQSILPKMSYRQDFYTLATATAENKLSNQPFHKQHKQHKMSKSPESPDPPVAVASPAVAAAAAVTTINDVLDTHLLANTKSHIEQTVALIRSEQQIVNPIIDALVRQIASSRTRTIHAIVDGRRKRLRSTRSIEEIHAELARS
jgi:hypothetical protein